MPATRNTRQRDTRAHNPLALPSFSSLPTLKSFPSFFSLRSSSTSTAASDTSTLVARTDTGLTASSSATLTSPAPSRSATLASLFPASPPNPFDLPEKDEKLDPAALAALTALSPYASDRPTEYYTPADAPTGYSTDTSPVYLRRPARARRADDLVQKGLDSSRLLQSISSSMDVESLQIVASSCLLLFDTVQTVRTNRTQCRQLLERVHQIVRALINLCEESQARGRPIGDDPASASSPYTVGGVSFNGARAGGGGGVAPHMARAIDAFAETLHTLHPLLQSLTHVGLFARILRSAEIRDQLNQVGEALTQAQDLFSVKTGLLTHAALGGARRAGAERHAELLRALGRGRDVETAPGAGAA